MKKRYAAVAGAVTLALIGLASVALADGWLLDPLTAELGSTRAALDQTLTKLGIQQSSQSGPTPLAVGAFTGPVPPAHCGLGSRPQDGLDGEVPLADRQDGRSSRGYSCNMKLLGQYQGEGASWVSQSYEKCAYMSTRWPNSEQSPGVQVIDVSDPRHPRFVEALRTAAMLSPWESLKVNQARGLLAAVSADVAFGVGTLDVYDIKSDCLHPKLLGSITATQLLANLPAGLRDLRTSISAALLLGHEGNWSPDGNTYWASGVLGGWLTAIDLSKPSTPRIIWAGSTGILDHGFSISNDGDTLYMAEVGNLAETLTGLPPGSMQAVEPDGLAIFDVSSIQHRALTPSIHMLGHDYWTNGGGGQMSIPISYQGHPYLVFVDELDEGGVRIIDIGNPAQPRTVSVLKLQIQLPQNLAIARRDVKGSGFFTYDSHYCTVDRQTNPTALACGYFGSGIRVFDIRNPYTPREIAYYVPPAQLGKNTELKGSEHAGVVVVTALNDVLNGGDIGQPAQQLATGPPTLNVDWCSSPPAFVSHNQIWVTCQDNGFLALQLTNHT